MLIFHILLIPAICASVAHIAETTDICEAGPSKYCAPEEKIKRFPGTKEEVDQFCKTITTLLECSANYMQACPTAKVPHQVVSIYESGIMNRLCDKNSLLYEEFTENAKCISENMEDLEDFGKCYSHVQALREKEPERVEQYEQLYMGETEESAVLELRQCLNTAFHLGCFVHNIKESCGLEAKQFAQRVISGSNIMDSECSPEHLSIAEQATQLLDMEIKEPSLLEFLM